MEDDHPLVSVIVPTHNGELFLAQALDSIVAQDYGPREILVIDDGSSDGSGGTARRYAETKYVHQVNQGNATARNNGARAATGSLLAFLDQDDTWTPDKLSVQVAHMRSRPQLGFTIGRLKFFHDPEETLPGWFRPELLLQDHVGWLPGTLMVRKDVFERTGGFDPKFSTASDVEWFSRARVAGIAFEVIPQVLLHKRVHGKAQSSVTQTYHPELLRVLKASIDRGRSGPPDHTRMA